MGAPTLLTLPQLAEGIGVEYRTLHSWVARGLVRPSVQSSRGTGSPNLFSPEDAVRTKVVVDLRRAGVSFELLTEIASQLDKHATALSDGAMVLVNGSVSIVDVQTAAAAIQYESLTLAYNTEHAVRHIRSSLAKKLA